ncbi:MAG: N-acetylmuramoyl-L-alanine amidase [Sulfitobacter sp.]
MLIPIAKATDGHQASVVFIHGLGGHPYGTWQARGKAEDGKALFWPTWLAQDMPGTDVYSIGYDASASGWTGQTMAIEDRADNICELLLGQGALRAGPVYFVCHSLGGIILKRVMLRLKERASHEAEAGQLYNAIQKIVFMATPHTGADKASLMAKFRLLIWPTSLTHALVDNAAALRQVNTSYRLLAQERADDLRHKVLFETRSTALGRIVREGSSDPGLVNTNVVGIDGDHITIVKPKSRNALTYKSVLDFLSDDLEEGETTPDPLILERPPYETSTQIDLIGVLKRVLILMIIVGLAWFLVSRTAPEIEPAKDEPDVVQIIYGVAAIENRAQRIIVAERLLDRPLSSKEKVLIESLQLATDSAEKVDTVRINELANSGSTQELRQLVAQIDIAACENDAGLEISENRLRCIGGDFVSFVGTPNKSGQIQSLEALVFHFTGSNSAEATIRWFASSNAKASTHLLVDRSGGIVQMVPFDTIAWHAGRSSLPERNLDGMNKYSVAVELVNLGKLKKRPDGTFENLLRMSVPLSEVDEITENAETTYWHKYTPQQVASAIAIAKAFRASDPNIAILGHSDISPMRKLDPGPALPLDEIDAKSR